MMQAINMHEAETKFFKLPKLDEAEKETAKLHGQLKAILQEALLL